MNVKEFIYETIETIFVSVVVILFIYSTVAGIEVIWGSSMEPTFHTGERILVEKISKRYRDFERGDIVVLIPRTDKKHYIKRIVGVPGDIIKILNCKIYISRDGQKYILEETYLQTNLCTQARDGLPEGRSLKLKDNEYIVLGDNRGVSVDSRIFGVVEKNEIIGKVIFRFWPFDKIGFI